MRKLSWLLPLLVLTGCSSLSVTDYRDHPIQFNPNEFFNQPLIAEGFVQDRSGRVTRTFVADIQASWDDNGGVLDETFLWSDGEEQVRVWRFERVEDNQFEGTAGDVKGMAEMQFAGNAIRMQYVLEVPLKNGNTIGINMDDWLHQVSDDTLVNVTEMRKFGFRVGRVVLTMRAAD